MRDHLHKEQIRADKARLSINDPAMDRTLQAADEDFVSDDLERELDEAVNEAEAPELMGTAKTVTGFQTAQITDAPATLDVVSAAKPAFVPGREVPVEVMIEAAQASLGPVFQQELLSVDEEPARRSPNTGTPNPKDAIGRRKPPFHFIPPVAEVHLGLAMENGGEKYGLFNWREHPVQAEIYYDAAKRHMLSWLDGEEFASDSGVHHLGHVMACCAIILDAQDRGHLIDFRNEKNRGGVSELIERLTMERKIRAGEVN